MNQFKDIFLGNETPKTKRAATAQKVVRAGGKHNDLENVGFTARHHTFFEMLGNFSFGDYFKKEAIHYAWSFLTETLKIPKAELYVTVFREDDEAATIWHEQESVPKDRIFRFDEKDNFWQMGDTGPCGPCSEIFVDRGAAYGPGEEKDVRAAIANGSERFVEVWNLVFMQFNRDASGVLNPLPHPSIDTGAGLERLAMVLQKAETNYDTDVFQTIIQRIETLSKKKYQKTDSSSASFRVIADHARATSFLIADGVLPSNEGRGYVLRRIMRRAIRHGRKLGFERPFFADICAAVVNDMGDHYPELRQQAALIAKVVLNEEEQFLRTLSKGLELLDEAFNALKGKKTLPGEVIFKLYDTYGFPVDLTRTIADEQGITLDEAGFEKEMAKQRAESKKHWKGSGDEARSANYVALADRIRSQGKASHFLGYDHLELQSTCTLILKNGEEVSEIQGPITDADFVEVQFTETPFYPEGGGQIGDQGRLSGSGVDAHVQSTQKPADGLILLQLDTLNGTLKVGAQYSQSVDLESRSLTARNHTATHLLHWALRAELGDHVKQAGSLVTSEFLRFDFSHFEPISREILQRIEDRINSKIQQGSFVAQELLPKEEALKKGAIAMFGEKYGDEVRVISVGDYSVEFCGGTHVHSIAEIGLFKILSESGIASGVRRMIAATSKEALAAIREGENQTYDIQNLLKLKNSKEILPRVEKLLDSERILRKEVEQLLAEKAQQASASIASSLERIGDIGVLVASIPEQPNEMKTLREWAEPLLSKHQPLALVLGMPSQSSGKAFLFAAVSKSITSKVSAAEIIQKFAPMLNGRGGGKPESAQAAGSDLAALDPTLKSIQTFLKDKLQGAQS